jgi:hypothetical protein
VKKLNKKALIYSVLGISTVIATAFITNLLAPQNTLGEGLRFFVPLFTGIIAGAAIFLRLKDESDIDLEELGEEED